MRHLDLFSGIGGFSIASDTVWPDVEHIFCDNEPFSQAVLKKHWPNSKIYGDIKQLKGSEIGTVDLVTGGFPCQPFSQAGARRGTEDDRHLWPEMLRVIRETSPRWIIGENVGGLVTWGEGLVLEQIHIDLESENYEVQAFIIPAISVNAPHRRDRIWIVAHSKSCNDRGGTREVPQKDAEIRKIGQDEGIAESGYTDTDTKDALGVRGRGRSKDNGQVLGSEISKIQTEGSDSSSGTRNVTNTKREGYTGEKHQEGSGPRYSGGTQSPDWSANWLEVASKLCRVDDGIPRRLDRNPRLKALGNAIVPQVAEEIMKCIKDLDI